MKTNFFFSKLTHFWFERPRANIRYSIGKNKNYCDREMVSSLDNLEYGETSKVTLIVISIINKKQQFGLSVNPN